LADLLAKEGTMKADVEIDIGSEITEMYSQICNYCEEKWQTEWSQVSSDQFHIIHPSIETSKQPSHTSRRLQVTINRLRFGRCGLNAYLYEMKMHSKVNGTLLPIQQTTDTISWNVVIT